MTGDRITLTVPARSDYAKTVRLTAAALASRMGMTYEEVDEVRMAAEEAFVYASDTLLDDGEVEFVFTVTDDALGIDVALGDEEPASDEDAERNTAYATFILESVCDTLEFVSDDTGAHLRLVKRAGSVDAD